MASENSESSSEATPMQVRVLALKAEEMRSKENIDEAIICLNEAKKINSKLGDQQLEALILEQFSLCYQKSDDYEKAMKNAREAIEIFRQLPGQTARAGNANGLLNLANIHVKLGKHKEAIQYQEQAIEILLKLRKEGPDLRLPMRVNMDKIHPAMKDMIKMMKSCKEGVRLSDEKSLAGAYGQMGEAYMETGEYEKGLELCQESLKINRNIGNKLGEAGDLQNMGNGYYFLGKTRKCIQYCQESTRIFTEIGNRNDASMSVGVLAMAYEALGDVENSKRYYQMCIDIKLDLKQFADLAIAYGNKGLLNYRIGLRKFLSFDDAKEALECSVEDFKLAIESTDKVLTSLSMDNNRTAFSDRFYRWYDELTAPLNLLGRSAAALLFLDLGRAKILRQLVYKQVNPQANNEDQSIFEASWLTIQNEKEKERIRDLSKEIQPPEADATVLFYNFNRAGILTIWILDANGCVFLKTSDPSGISSTAQEELKDNVRKLLEQASVVLPRGYSFFTQSLVDFQNENMKASDDGKEVKVSETKRDYRSPATRADQPYDDLTKEARSRLYRSLIDPVKGFIKGTKLIIVPQRCLFFAPFSSFIDENGCLLSEKYQIQIIPSIHVLAMSIQSSSGKPIGNSLFVGDPEVQLPGLSRLPWAAKEVQYLASLLDSKPLLGPMATKGKVLKVMSEASIIHIAAHAHEQAGHIFLAPDESKSTAHPTSSSYLLTQSDILKRKLTARLVVLSCCDTGKGQVSSEGVIGIARSFLGAGASSVLVTLWRINDKFTKLFMTVFYEKILEEKSACLALKETMNEFQRSVGFKSFTFWAAFEIMGEDVRFSKAEIEEIRRNNKLKI